MHIAEKVLPNESIIICAASLIDASIDSPTWFIAKPELSRLCGELAAYMIACMHICLPLHTGV